MDVRKHGESYNKGVAALVAGAWKGECPTAWVVTHKDGDRRNNAASNLAYVSRSESVRARLPTVNSQAKLTPDDVREMRRLHEGNWLVSELAREFGVSVSAVSAAVQGRTWQDV